MNLKHQPREVRIDPALVERRIRMLKAHIAVRTLRPTRRKKMQAELNTLLNIQTSYNKAMEERKQAIINAITKQRLAADQKKLEEVSPELTPVAQEANEAHRAAMIGMLPGLGAPIEETLEGIAETEEKKE